jgi:hypothetical protein
MLSSSCFILTSIKQFVSNITFILTPPGQSIFPLIILFYATGNVLQHRNTPTVTLSLFHDIMVPTSSNSSLLEEIFFTAILHWRIFLLILVVVRTVK